MPPLKDRLLDIRRQKRQVEQPADKAAADLLSLGDLRGYYSPMNMPDTSARYVIVFV